MQGTSPELELTGPYEEWPNHPVRIFDPQEGKIYEATEIFTNDGSRMPTPQELILAAIHGQARQRAEEA